MEIPAGWERSAPAEVNREAPDDVVEAIRSLRARGGEPMQTKRESAGHLNAPRPRR